MRGRWIWAVAAVGYACFLFWYDNTRGPLSDEEVAHYVESAAERPGMTAERLEVLRAFLESDDGGEFFMLNLIRMQPEPVPMPGTGELTPPEELLEAYTRPFFAEMVRRATHPTFYGPAVAGYVDAWNAAPNPGWTNGGIVRYRSRRDVVEVVSNPDFRAIHPFKEAAMSHTLAFPIAPALVVFGPRVTLGLATALAAALLHLLVLSQRLKASSSADRSAG